MGLLANDRVTVHEDGDEENDDVGDEEENVSYSTEGETSVHVGAGRITPSSADDRADEACEKQNIDVADGSEITIQSRRDAIPSTEPAD